MIPRALPGTLALVIVSVAVYLLMMTGLTESVFAALSISNYIEPVLPEVRQGEVWRLVTPMFMHFGLFHIVFNMLWTWELGRIIEWRQGISRIAILALLISGVSNYAQYVIEGPYFGGMSAVVYGFFGYVWIQGIVNPRFGIRLNPVIVKLLLGWFLVCWTGLLEWFGIHVANTAHTAGLVSGVLLALAFSLVDRRAG